MSVYDRLVTVCIDMETEEALAYLKGKKVNISKLFRQLMQEQAEKEGYKGRK